MISLGMIVRNCESTLQKCLESVAPYVDEIVIGLGGESTDGTEEIARQFTDKIIPIEWKNDFAEARNIVLQATTGDYFLWLDGDDELVGGERMQQLIADYPQVEAFYWGYDYARDEHGNCLCYLVRERLIKKSRQWAWRGAIHEVLLGPPEHTRMLVQDILVRHHPEPHDDNRNLEILRSQLEISEPNPEPRILMYLGTENANRGNYTEALLHLQRYVSLSGWDEEKYQAQHRIADLFRVMGQLQRARMADFEAISIRPDWPDAYYGLAETSFFEGKYQEAVEWTKAGGTKDPPQTFMIVNPRDYDLNPLVVLGNAYAQLGAFDVAADNFRQALQLVPDPRLAHNLRMIEEELEGRSVVDAFLKVWTHLAQNDEWLKARQLFDSVPKLIEKVPPIQEKHQFTIASTAHVENPKLMERSYIENPHWAPMDEELLWSSSWLNHPRLQFAMKVAKSVGALDVADLGSSDGFIGLRLSEKLGVEVTGYDLDPRCVELANSRAKEHKLPAKFYQSAIDDIQPTKGAKHALALLFEVIEHVKDPEATLDKLESLADHIAITTPYLAWQSPAPGWDQQELKGHLRIFDTEDLERMLGRRGRIHNLYRQPYGESGWIFADYRPGGSTSGNITILAAGAPEAWSPLSFEANGLGGSETAIVRLGEGFAKLGKSVTVYSTIDNEGYYNSVRYRHQQKYIPGIASDLFIAWRSPELVDQMLNAKKKVLWMHDTDVGDRLTPERADKFDAIVVLTEWHRDFMLEKYPFLIGSSKLVVIPNGVDVDRFLEIYPARHPKRVVYSSSPDRGLDLILEHIWPKVLAAVPEAELHIYYGWNNFDKFIPMFPQLGEFKSRVMDLISRSKNVVQHGRVSQKKLAREMLEAGVWLYPTYFTETYCITAIEAQLAGLIPVTNQLAALGETVKSGIIIDGDVSDPEVLDQFAQATIEAMTAHYKFDRDTIRNLAPAVTWDKVAEMWSKRWLAV